MTLFRAFAAIFLLAVSPIAASPAAWAQPADFDGFLLALSLAPSFCELSPANAGKPECRTLTEPAFRATPLTIHGLWPQNAGLSVNRQPQDCGGPPLGELSLPLRQSLARYMPAGPGLAGYEWRKHGTCSGLAPKDYFATEIRLTRMVDDALGSVISGAEGRALPPADIIAAASAHDPALGHAVVVACRAPRGGGAPVIEEIRVALSRSLAPMPAESLGMRQISGCPSSGGLVPGVGR